MDSKNKIHPFLNTNYIHGNVRFNVHEHDPIDGLSRFAIGYHMAGKTLVEKLETDEGYADYEAYPIFFLYRHSLELFLKAIVYMGARLLNLISNDKIDNNKLLTKHGLVRLLPPIKTIFKRLDWDKDFGIEHIHSFEDFEKLIKAIEKIDPQSYSFRYPVNTKGVSPLPKNIMLNAISFGKNMNPLLEVLDGAITGLDDYLDLAHDELDAFREFL